MRANIQEVEPVETAGSAFEIVSRGCRKIESRSVGVSTFVVPAKAGTSLAEVKILGFIAVKGQLDDTH